MHSCAFQVLRIYDTFGFEIAEILLGNFVLMRMIDIILKKLMLLIFPEEWRSIFVDSATLLRMLRLFHQPGRFSQIDTAAKKPPNHLKLWLLMIPVIGIDRWEGTLCSNQLGWSNGWLNWGQGVGWFGPHGKLIKNYKRYDFSFTELSGEDVCVPLEKPLPTWQCVKKADGIGYSCHEVWQF